MANTNTTTAAAPKKIGTPKEPFTLETEETIVEGKPYRAAWGEGLVDEDLDAGIDADDLAPEIGTGDRYDVYELSILTGIPQRRIRSGELTPAEILHIQDTQSL